MSLFQLFVILKASCPTERRHRATRRTRKRPAAEDKVNLTLNVKITTHAFTAVIPRPPCRPTLHILLRVPQKKPLQNLLPPSTLHPGAVSPSSSPFRCSYFSQCHSGGIPPPLRDYHFQRVGYLLWRMQMYVCRVRPWWTMLGLIT